MARKHKNGERRKRVTQRGGGNGSVQNGSDPNGSDPNGSSEQPTGSAQQIAPATITTSTSRYGASWLWPTSFPKLFGSSSSSSNTSPSNGSSKPWYQIFGGKKTFKNRNKTMKRPRTMRVIKSPRVVGRIYSDSCGFCVAMKDAWEKMKTKIQEQGKELVKFVDIEAQEMNEKLDDLNKRLVLPQKVSIQGGFPTLFKIHRGKVEYYGGERSADKMYEWYMK